MRGFIAIAIKRKMQEVTCLFNFAEVYVFGTVGLEGAALFDLFEVAEAGHLPAFADGEGTVAKIDEHFAALQVVLGDGLCGVALGCVGQQQYGYIVFCFDVLQAAHEGKSASSGVGIVLQAVDIIDNKHFGFGGEYGVLYLVFNILLIAAEFVHFVGIGVGDGAGEPFVEMIAARFAAAVTLAELHIGKFIVEIQHTAGCGVHLQARDRLAATDAVADLHGEDGFAGIGIGEEDAQLALVPKAVEQHFGPGFFGGFAQPFVYILNNKFRLAAGAFGPGMLQLPGGWFGCGFWFGDWTDSAGFVADIFDDCRAFEHDVEL